MTDATPPLVPPPRPRDAGVVRRVERVLLEQFTPTCVLVNESGEVVYFSGRTGRYLEPPPGAPSADLFEMARPGLRTELRAALDEAVTTKAEVVRAAAVVDGDGKECPVTLVVRPFVEAGEEAAVYMVVFRERNEELAGLLKRAEELEHLVASTDIAVIFLDRALRVVRYTPAATRVFRLIESDVGRAIGDITSRVAYPGLERDVQTVLANVAPLDREVAAMHGPGRFVVRLRPFGTPDGVALAFLDVTELKVAEDRSRRREEQFRRALEEAPVPVVVHREDGRIDLVNRAFLELTGYSAEEIPDVDSWTRRAYGERARDVKSAVARLFNLTGRVDEGEFHVRTKAGRERVWHFYSTPFSSPADGQRQVISMAVDVTEARRSRDMLRQVTDALPVLISYVDRDERYQFVNAAYSRWFGTPAERIIGMTVRELIGDAAHAAVAPYIRRVLAGEPQSWQRELTYRSGSVRHVQGEYIPHRGGDGRTEGYFSLITDVTRRQQEELATRTRARQQEAVARLGQKALGSGDFLELANRAANVVATTLEVELAKVLELLPGGDAFRLVAGVGWRPGLVGSATVPTGDDSQAGYTLRSSGPVIVHDLQTEVRFPGPALLREHGVRSGLSVLIGPQGEPYGVLGAHTTRLRAFSGEDVHFLEAVAHLLAAALQRQRHLDSLREADRRKDEFLAMLAHELRNPLAPIRNVLPILSNPDVPADTIRGLQPMLHRQVGQMARLLDDLLDVSRVSRGRINLQRTAVEVAAVVAVAVEAVQAEVEARGQKLTVTLPREPVHLFADPARLAQVIGNLLHNSSKFTDDRGKIDLIAGVDGEEVVIRVVDNGAGIDPEFLPHVFDLFRQAETTIHRSRGGLGLGLPLVRTLVQMHGGRVTARSEGPGRGSEFTLRLPTAPAPAGSPRITSAVPTGAPRRVLVVDDNQDAAESLALFLQAVGHEVHTAADGLTALALAATLLPSAVVLDIGLPGLDGYEVARRLRAMEGMTDAMLIAVSGYTQDADRARSREAGIEHHLPKPTDPMMIATLIAAQEPR